MMRSVILAFSFFSAGIVSAHAGCREDIQAFLAAGEEWQGYSIETRSSMGGNPIQHTKQFFADYSHFYQIVRETGVHWLVLGEQEFTSSDGVNWKSSTMRGENWLEETRARNARLREGISDTKCDTETVDNAEFLRYRHVQSTEEPVQSVSEVITWITPDTGLPAKRWMNTKVSGQEIEMVVTYDWESPVDLPTP